MRKLGKQEIIELVKIVANAMREDNEEKIAEVLNGNLPKMGINIKVTPQEIKDTVEKYEDEELGVLFIGADDVIYLVLKKAGFNVIKNGRSVILIQKCLSEKTRLGHPIEGVCITVIGDPDSGMLSFNNIFISGYRFGLDTLIVDDNTLVDVHNLFGNKFESLINKLRQEIMAEAILYAVKNKKNLEEIKDKIENLLDELHELYNEYSKKK